MKFPDISNVPEPPTRKMTLIEYARFSEQRLRANPAITLGNCMSVRTDESEIKVPFSFRSDR